MAKHGVIVLACQVSPFHLTFTQINSEMNCIAKNKYSECQRLDTRRRSENLIGISPRVKKGNNIVCTHYVKVFYILCLCIILFDTSKASENLTFILKQSLILSSFCTCVTIKSIIICCLAAMKIEGSIEEMISNLFQHCDVYFEDVNVNCDPEHVLN